MIYKLKDNRLVLQLLYEDCVRYAEEISLIEEDYLWPDVSVYVDNPQSIKSFLIVSLASFNGTEKNLSAYVFAEDACMIQEFASTLESKRGFRMHLQTAAENEIHVKRLMKWLPKTYTVRYCRADSNTFKPYYIHKDRAVRLTPDNIRSLQPSASPHFMKRMETALVYGYVTENGKLVGTSGVGFLNKKSFVISFTQTQPEYRNKGIAKCLTSLASTLLINNGLIGVYSADATNEPSLRVAKALGFVPHCDLMCFHN